MLENGADGSEGCDLAQAYSIASRIGRIEIAAEPASRHATPDVRAERSLSHCSRLAFVLDEMDEACAV
jgi:hypothetical protein